MKFMETPKGGLSWLCMAGLVLAATQIMRRFPVCRFRMLYINAVLHIMFHSGCRYACIAALLHAETATSSALLNADAFSMPKSGR